MRYRRMIVDVTGKMSYVFLIMQIGWMLTLFAPLFLGVDFDKLAQPPVDSSPLRVEVPEIPFVSMAIGIVVVTLCIALTLYFVLSLPGKAAKASSMVLHTSSEATTAKILKSRRLKNQKTTKKQRRQISSRTLWIIKISLVAVVFVLSLAAPRNEQLTPQVILAMSSILGAMALGGVVLQLFLARVLNVDYSKSS